MVDIQFKGKTVAIPSTLEELSPDQYKGYLFLTVVLKRGIIEEDGFKAKLMGILLGLKADITDYTKDIAESLIAQLDKLDGFFIDDNGTRTPATSTGRNMLPEFAGWKAKVGDMLNGMTFGDFVEAVALMGEIHDQGEDGQEEAFKNIARLMYQPAEQAQEEEPPVLLAIHAVTLFTANFYGRLSLPRTCSDHEKMERFYGKMSALLLQYGQTEELLTVLAREELTENGNWVSYQRDNKPDISI